MRKRAISQIIIIISLCILIIGCTPEIDFVAIKTGSVGDTYFPLSGAIAKSISNNNPYITVINYTGGTSIANCILIRDGKTESAIVRNNAAHMAYNGEDIFKDNPITNIRAIASLYEEAIQIVTLANSNLNKITDLRNKKVAVGEKKSAEILDAKNVLNAYDMTLDDIEAIYISQKDAIKQLKSGEIDAAIVTDEYPSQSITILASETDIRLIPIDENKIQTMIDSSPYYTKTVIKAKTYQGTDIDIFTASNMAIWICSSSLSSELVYNMLDGMWENQNVIVSEHKKGVEVTLDTALDGISIPLHIGAYTYYEEQGLFD